MLGILSNDSGKVSMRAEKKHDPIIQLSHVSTIKSDLECLLLNPKKLFYVEEWGAKCRKDLQKTQKNKDFNFHCKMCANPIKKEMYIFVLILF